MAQPRHKAVVQRPRGGWTARLVVPGAVLAMITTSAVAAGWPDPEPVGGSATSAIGATFSPESAMDIRNQVLDRAEEERASRSASRAPLPPKPKPKPKPAPVPPEPKVVDHLFVTTLLNVWTGPGEDTTYLTALPAGTKVAVTGRVDGIWAEVVRDDQSRWVKGAYLAEEKPQPEPEPEPEEVETDTGGISYEPCASGSSVESGLTADAIRVYRAVCAEFPEISSYGGLGGGGDHGEGRALDIMVSGSLGDAVADYVRANYSALGVSEVIWSQQIWTVQRSSEGWRWMEDRGSDTANHYDHVHVTVYGDSGG